MKEKGRSRARHRKPYGLCKRFLAALIAAVMITTNIGTDLTTAYAAESSDSVTFETVSYTHLDVYKRQG